MYFCPYTEYDDERYLFYAEELQFIQTEKGEIKMRKKALALTLALSLGLSLSACGKEKKNDGTTAAQNTEVVTETPDQPQTEEPATEKKESFSDNYKPKYENLAADAKSSEASKLTYIREDEKETSEEFVSAKDYRSLSKASIRFFNECLTSEGAGKNVLISPYSIHEALGMTALGANGKTREELEHMIGDDLTMSQISPSLAYVAARMQGDRKVSWNVANSIWINEDVPGLKTLKVSYLEEAGKYYSPEIYRLPFDAAAAEEMNAWVNHETKGMIPTILENAPEGEMHLMNAVAFEGEWASPFWDNNIVEDFEFTNADGSTSNVNLLCCDGDGYFTLNGGAGFIKYYDGYEYAFVGILPQTGMTPEEYISKLDESEKSFSDAVLEAGGGKVWIEFPEFQGQYENILNDEMEACGVVEAFHENADFTGFSDDTALKIGSVHHKTYIDVNRQGTKAAAVTDVMVDGAMEIEDEPPILALDRPFVYAIVDMATGMPIFLGVQNSME